MSDVFQNIKSKAEAIVQIPRRQTQYSTTPDNLPEELQFSDLVNTQELPDLTAVELDASDITDEKVSWTLNKDKVLCGSSKK